MPKVRGGGACGASGGRRRKYRLRPESTAERGIQPPLPRSTRTTTSCSSEDRRNCMHDGSLLSRYSITHKQTAVAAQRVWKLDTFAFSLFPLRARTCCSIFLCEWSSHGHS